MSLPCLIGILVLAITSAVGSCREKEKFDASNNQDITLFSNDEKNYIPQNRDYIYPIDLPLTDWNLVQCNLSTSYSWDLEFLNITNLQPYLGVDYPIINPVGDLQNWHNLQSDYPNGIIGDDDRELIQNDYSWPYLPTSRLNIKHYFYDGNSINIQNYVGTAFMVAPNIALTCAHCVFGSVLNPYTLINERKFANELILKFGTGSSSFFKSVSQTIILKDYFLTLNYQYDWAVLILSEDIGYSTGWYDIQTDYDLLGGSVYSYGYPTDFNDNMCYTNGIIIGYENTTEVLYKTTMDLQGGQSGSPILVNYNNKKVSIGIFGFSHGHDYTGGVVITPLVKVLTIIYSNYRTSFNLNLIRPSEYGFDESYPTDSYTSSNYQTSYSSLTFATKRFRTGYIQNQFIVLSCIRSNINDAFIEYHLPFSIKMFQIDLTHWRDAQYDLLTASNGTAYLQIKNSNNEWINYLDLLSSSSNLPRDRSNPKPYVVRYSDTFTDFRIIIHYNLTFNGNTNRGRICIGDIYVFDF